MNSIKGGSKKPSEASIKNKEKEKRTPQNPSSSEGMHWEPSFQIDWDSQASKKDITIDNMSLQNDAQT